MLWSNLVQSRETTSLRYRNPKHRNVSLRSHHCAHRRRRNAKPSVSKGVQVFNGAAIYQPARNGNGRVSRRHQPICPHLGAALKDQDTARRFNRPLLWMLGCTNAVDNASLHCYVAQIWLIWHILLKCSTFRLYSFCSKDMNEYQYTLFVIGLCGGLVQSDIIASQGWRRKGSTLDLAVEGLPITSRLLFRP